MGIVNLTLPSIGAPNSTEDADVLSSFIALQNTVNGNLDSANLANDAVGSAEIANGAVTPAKLATAPRAELNKTTAQGIPRITSTLVSFAEISDNDNLFDPATPTRLTIRTPGVYLVTGFVTWAGNDNGSRLTVLRHNGADVCRNEGPPNGPVFVQQPVSVLIAAAAGDFVEMFAFHGSSAASLDITSGLLRAVRVAS